MPVNPFITDAQATQKVQEMGGKIASICKNNWGLVRDSYVPKTKHPIVSFIADDSTSQIRDWFLPIFESKGVLCTVAVIGGKLGEPGRMTMEDVKEWYSKGFDMANHTYYHITNQDPEDYRESVYKGKFLLEQNGIDCPVFVAPNGEGGQWRRKIIKEYHECNFVTQIDYTNRYPLYTYRIRRMSFDDLSIEDCMEAVDNINNSGGWLIFAVHPAYSRYNSGEGFEERRQDVANLIDYIKQKEIYILTAKDAFQYYRNFLEVGSKGIDEEYYLMGMDGSEEGSLLNYI